MSEIKAPEYETEHIPFYLHCAKCGHLSTGHIRGGPCGICSQEFPEWSADCDGFEPLAPPPDVLTVCSCCRSLAPDANRMGEDCLRCGDGVYVPRRGDVCSLCKGAGWIDASVAPRECAECEGNGWRE